jgi:hypothetical protein
MLQLHSVLQMLHKQAIGLLANCALHATASDMSL